MTRWLQFTGSLALLAVALSVPFLAWRAARVLQSVDEAAQAVKAGAQVIPAITEAISGPRGTLHEVNKAVVKIGDAIVTTQLQERQSAPHVIAAMDTFRDAAGSLKEAAAALTGTAQGATEALAEGKRTIAAAQPLLVSLTATADASAQTVRTFNGRLSDPRIDAILDSFKTMADSGAGISTDLRKVTDKASADYLTPKPWYRKVGRFASDAFDYGALAARHIP